jgi:hypothetical protein
MRGDALDASARLAVVRAMFSSSSFLRHFTGVDSAGDSELATTVAIKTRPSIPQVAMT